jgi:hypothetical protein
MFWNPEGFILWKNPCVSPRIFPRTAALKPKPFEASSQNVFLLHKDFHHFFRKKPFYKNYMRWILFIYFFSIFFFFSRLQKISWYCTLTHDGWGAKQIGKTNHPHIWLQNNILSWVPTEKWFARDNITASKFEIGIKNIWEQLKRYYIF